MVMPNNLSEREKKVYRIANNALYFDDSSDYQTALWEILNCLNPGIDPYEELKHIKKNGQVQQMENTFKVNEVVMIKRTSGKWEEGVIYKITPYGVVVHIRVTDNFRGEPYNGPPMAGSKFIRNEKYETHLKKLTEVQ